MSRKKKPSLPFNRLNRYTVAAAIIVILSAGALFMRLHHTKNASTPIGSTGNLTKTASSGEVNLKPATTQDQQDSDNRKASAAQQDKAASSGVQTATANPVISYAGADGVYAYVPGVFEDGGTCTAAFTQGAQVISKTSAGFKDATHTTCTPFDNLSYLNSGQWSVKVSYSSQAYSGVSASSTITKP